MHILSLLAYNAGLQLYRLGIGIAAPFSTKARQWVQGRTAVIPTISKQSNEKVVWVHCASLGEFEQARPVIEQLRADYMNVKIVLTFFSPSGYEVRKNYSGVDAVLYLPLDTKSNAEAFINAIQPDIALFVKYEFWHHYLHTLKQRGIPTILFSSIFRPGQVFFKWHGGFYADMLRCFSKIFVQNEQSASLLQQLNISAEVAYDTRFDRVIAIAEAHNTYPLIQQFKGPAKLLIAGSTWAKDEALIKEPIKDRLLPNYKYIIAPHNIDVAAIDALVSELPNAAKWSELNESNVTNAQVLVVDNIGHLAHLYAYADIVYVGGGFNASVHNVLEPAVYGVPLLFGPNHTKSNEAIELQAEGAAFAVSNYEQLKQQLLKLNSHTELFNQAAIASKNYVYAHRGGTGQIMQYLHNTLK